MTAPRKTAPPLPDLEVGDLAVDLAQLEQHGARPPRQRRAVGRQRNAARQPVAKRHAKDVLHLGDHARGGGLRDVEHMRRGAHLAAVVERDDHAHVAELQAAAQQAFAVAAERRRHRVRPAPVQLIVHPYDEDPVHAACRRHTKKSYQTS